MRSAASCASVSSRSSVSRHASPLSTVWSHLLLFADESYAKSARQESGHFGGSTEADAYL